MASSSSLVRVYRLCRRDRTSLDGAGGLHADGRWHRRGSRIVYTAATLSLALLETRVHQTAAPRGWVSLEVAVPASLVETLDASLLPETWVSDRALTQAAGESWLQQSRSAVLAVPSVIVPQERN